MSIERLQSIPLLPCACANLRRASRVVTRMYNDELRSSDLEVTQFTLLMTLDITGEIGQKELGKLLAMDSTTLTRTLGLLSQHNWIREKPGEDRRQKLISLTATGRKRFREAQILWEAAQRKLRAGLGEPAWRQMGQLLEAITSAGAKK